ncbi:MAG: hypothetical protein K2V38_16815 [Gemmataceae bacterium]|nr:hypothetical protein [Gemmataceae bacterium]
MLLGMGFRRHRPPEPRRGHGTLYTASLDGNAAAQALVRGVAEWVAGYEHRIAETLGLDYRAGVLDTRDKPPAVPAQAMAGGWERVARKAFRCDGGRDAAGPWGRLLASLRVGGSTGGRYPARSPGRLPPSGLLTGQRTNWQEGRGLGRR